jgi:hypothetical protein
MKVMEFPLEVECELSLSGNIACTPEQLTAAGVPDVPSRFCCHIWYFARPNEAVIIEE